MVLCNQAWCFSCEGTPAACDYCEELVSKQQARSLREEETKKAKALAAAKLADAVAKLKVGDGTEAGVTTGPLIDARAVEKVQRHLKDATDKGATVIAGGKPHELGGFFFEPTILTGVDSSMAVAREETFGPLAPLFRFSDEADVVRQANDTEFGLAAYFYARDLSRVFRVAEALEYGMVGINTGLISNEVAPFGGMKSSGLGREGSKYGIEEYVEIKYLCLGGI